MSPSSSRCGRSSRPDTAVIRRTLADAGELTQGLCSPWQNDYRECSCYYWASARPDFVNVETDADRAEQGRQLDTEGAHRRLRARRLRGLPPDHVRRSVPALGEACSGFRSAAGMCRTTARRTRSGRQQERSSLARRPSLHGRVGAAGAARPSDRDGARAASVRRRRQPPVRRRAPPCSASFEAAMAKAAPDELDDLLQRVGLGRPPADRRSRRCRRRRSARSRWPSRRSAISAAPIAMPSRASSAAPAKNMALSGCRSRRSICWSRGAEPGARLNLAFLGGEPLVNRQVLRAATRRAARTRARKRGARITFSITTNGTLLTEDDARFFEEHGFAVTVSLDGLRDAARRAAALSKPAAAASTSIMRRRRAAAGARSGACRSPRG